ncbi:beta-2-microglobulin-like [Cottoperca gobio]|uniref:Beta-2-microglobulin n=1 Tax=Cottoperca gobio TaxID=56716 RepID=A0A6J2S7J8_COTGO|nr:beta-2-microglobulin-like [Cottoperca gobio]
MFSFAVVVGLLCVLPSEAKESAPNVQVYSREPGTIGKANTLICHVSNFYPPEINIELLKDGKVMSSANQTELIFGEKWDYYLTKHVPFTPLANEKFICKVVHLGKSNDYFWESDM